MRIRDWSSDVCSSDLADVRAPTPTAAAEMAVPVRAELQAQLATWNGRIIGAANRQQALCGERLAALARHLPRREALYAPQRQRLDDAGDRLDRGQRHRLTVIAERLATRDRKSPRLNSSP